MSGTLLIRSRSGTQEVPLRDASLTLGRASDNDVRLLHPVVSLHHARIDFAEDGASVIDLGSSNGTFVNGEELAPREPRAFTADDEIEMGPFLLRLQEDGAQGTGAPRGAAGGETTAASPLTAEPAVEVAGADTTAAREASRIAAVGAPRPIAVVAADTEPPRLIVVTPEGRQEIPLQPREWSVGRDPDNDVVVPAPAVSRHHARLLPHDGTFEIVDRGSTNGLVVAGRRVERHVLADGDVIAIGSHVSLEFRAAPTEGAAAELHDVEETAAARSGIVTLGEGESMVLGRSEAADLSLDHPQASLRHARVSRRNGRLVVEDLGSSTGLFVNGSRVERRELREGDVVRLAARRLVLRHDQLEMADDEGTLGLEARHLSVTVAGGKKILDDVSLTVRPHQFVAVVGGSGSGKSTLVNALCGFRPATEGAVFVNGVDLYGEFDAYRTELGYVPQDDIIHLELPVERALEYAARLRMPADTTDEERQNRVREVLRQLDLESSADVPIQQLSGGQRKRASIGVELLTRPSLFFLDEATSGLDPLTETQLMKLLRRIADDGRTVVLITHATKNVMLCDAVLVLARGGRLAYEGPPDEALRYFGVRDFDDIYERLEERPPEEWAARQRRASLRAVSEMPSTGATPPTGGGGRATAAALPAVRRASSLEEFLVLSRRQLDIVFRDRKTAALLLLLAPILGILDFVVWERHVFDPLHGSATTAVTMFFVVTLITVLVGTVTSVREIVKEDAIYRRERMIGLRVVPYVASKVAVGSLFALYSALILYMFMLLAVDFSHLTPAGLGALFVPFALGTLAGLAWGLLISAIAPSEDRAMLLIILVLVPQFVFSGGMVPMDDLGIAGRGIGLVTSTRWELGALVTTAQVKSGACRQPDLSDCSMPGMQSLQSVGERQALVRSLDAQYGDIFKVNVVFYCAMCLALTMLLLFIVLALQKRKDRRLT